MSEYPIRFKAVVPAGGSGTRLGAALPKQYLSMGGVSMLERSVEALLQAEWIDTVVIVVAPDDRRVQGLFAASARVHILPRGGATRRDSVLAGVRFLNEQIGAHPDDWVMVHDAARPGLSLTALERLRDAVLGWEGGALLALPVADTVKRAESARSGPVRVAQTLPREGLWLAQTPQLGRGAALQRALEQHADVTDEASALEAAGIAVRLVHGEGRNFKVTTADDLAMMRALLSGEGDGG